MADGLESGNDKACTGIIKVSEMENGLEERIQSCQLEDGNIYDPKAAGPTTGKPSFPTVFINAGGITEYVDEAGNKWEVDNYKNGGNYASTDSVIMGAGEEGSTLYQTERWFPRGTSATYEIPVLTETHDYEVTLYFSESFINVSRRVFNVFVEGSRVLADVNIFDTVGFLAVSGPFSFRRVKVSDGFLTVFFEHINENPKISAIQVRLMDPSETDSPTTSPRLL